MNLVTNHAKKIDKILGDPIHDDGSNATDVAIVSASCTDQQKANIGFVDGTACR